MSIHIQNSSEDQARRLHEKTQASRLTQLAVEGAGLSHWEAGVLVDVVKEVYFAEPEDRPIQPGEMRYVCISADEGAGKPLSKCRQQTVVLTLLDEQDRDLLLQKGAEALRRHRVLRLTEQAQEQRGLLTQEDLAQLLSCDVRTIRRDIKALKGLGIIVATRGQQKDIGPTVSHKGVAIKHWLQGHEPVGVARKINHSLPAVERYLQHFSRVVYLTQKGFHSYEIALTLGIATSTVNTYLEVHEASHWKSEYQRRYAEIALIGQQHFEAEDLKKIRLCDSGGQAPTGGSHD